MVAAAADAELQLGRWHSSAAAACVLNKLIAPAAWFRPAATAMRELSWRFCRTRSVAAANSCGITRPSHVLDAGARRALHASGQRLRTQCLDVPPLAPPHPPSPPFAPSVSSSFSQIISTPAAPGPPSSPSIACCTSRCSFAPSFIAFSNCVIASTSAGVRVVVSALRRHVQRPAVPGSAQLPAIRHRQHFQFSRHIVSNNL